MRYTLILLVLIALTSCKQTAKQAEKKFIKKELTKEISGEIIENSAKKKVLKSSLKNSLSKATAKPLTKEISKGLSEASLKIINKLPTKEKNLLIEELKANPAAAKLINANPTQYVSTILKKSAATAIPEGRAALAVTQSKNYPGKYFPEINNLGKEGKQFMYVFNDKLLKARRAAITISDQVPSVSAIAKCNPKHLCLDKAKDAGILQKNMLAVMDKNLKKIANAFGGFEAHHIIPGDASFPSAVKARKLMEKLGLNINHPSNGVFLPGDANSIFKGYIHKGGHTEEYYNSVWNAVKGCRTQEELINKLNILGKKLATGDSSIALYNTCTKIV